jgi:dihydroflavonol-4-reductase
LPVFEKCMVCNIRHCRLFRSLATAEIMQSSKPLILLTGASGLVGSHTLSALLNRSFQVRLLSRNPAMDEQLIRPVLKHYGHENAELHFFQGDLRNLGTLEDALDQVQAVIHTAALVSTDRRDQQLMFKTNVEGTANLVNLSLDMGVQWFCHLSSVATLGPNPDGLVDEDYFWKQQKSSTAYAITKYQAEQEVWRAKEEGLNAMVVNPSFVVGPSLRDTSSTRLFNALERGLPGILKGESGYVDARDVAEAIVELLVRNEHGYRLILNAENLSTEHFVAEICEQVKLKKPRVIESSIGLNLALFVSTIQRLFGSRSAPLSRDLIRMSTSKNRYDNALSVQRLQMQYNRITEAIRNTLEFRAHYKIG